MASRVRVENVTACRVSINGSEQKTESRVSASFGAPLAPGQLRELREAMKRAGMDFDYWESPEGEGFAFGFSSTSGRRSR